MKTYFDHEKLDVYQDAIAFCGWVGDLLADVGGKIAAKDQLDRASTSVPLNIAEANGKFSDADRADSLRLVADQRWNARLASTSWSRESSFRQNKSLQRTSGSLQLLIC